MDSALTIHRLHFAFTITYHYLFPQLTMGLAPLIVLFKSLALWKGDERYNRAARFWAKVFAINFLFGVITGIPSAWPGSRMNGRWVRALSCCRIVSRALAAISTSTRRRWAATPII